MQTAPSQVHQPETQSHPDRLFAASSLFLSVELLVLVVLAHLATTGPH
jgi:hypothetical protein